MILVRHLCRIPKVGASKWNFAQPPKIAHDLHILTSSTRDLSTWPQRSENAAHHCLKPIRKLRSSGTGCADRSAVISAMGRFDVLDKLHAVVLLAVKRPREALLNPTKLLD